MKPGGIKMIKEILSLDNWRDAVKQRTKNLKRPKRAERSIRSRTIEESDALGKNVILAWRAALESKILIKDPCERSYTICIPKKKF